tara:strand:+ start:624 stop:1271 length:648 start_codon:yes stop_codon:yes gene_type:complete
MGYLNNTQIVVDAILTKKGRELLAKGEDQFKITQFALADDEIDYLLWNAAHPKGTDYYGEAIDNLPMIEANPDETQIMRYKLVTLPKSTAKMPMVTVVGGPFTFTNPGDTIPFEPQTTGGLSNDTLGYTVILHDSDSAVLDVLEPAPGFTGATIPTFLSDDDQKQSISAVGLKFQLTSKSQPNEDLNTTLTVIGNETGGTTTVTCTVKKTVLQVT